MNRTDVLKKLDEAIQGLQRSKDLIESGINPELSDLEVNLDECKEFLSEKHDLESSAFPRYFHDLNKEEPTEGAVILKDLGEWIDLTHALIDTDKILIRFKERGVSKETEMDFYRQIGVDEECQELCYAMNRLPGVITLVSCCGHYRDPYRIWFRCTDTISLAILSRAVNRRYSTGKFVIKVDSSDINPRNEFLLESTKTFKCQSEMEKVLEIFLDNIRHWTDKSFRDYFTNIK